MDCPERSWLLHRVEDAALAYKAALIAMRCDQWPGPPPEKLKELAEAAERAWDEFQGHVEGHQCRGAWSCVEKS
jgi:hypothetical protein